MVYTIEDLHLLWDLTFVVVLIKAAMVRTVPSIGIYLEGFIVLAVAVTV